jgi:hypothetical protein
MALFGDERRQDREADPEPADRRSATSGDSPLSRELVQGGVLLIAADAC